MRSFLVIALLVAVPVLGMVLPRLTIGNGLEQYEGDRRQLAEQALANAGAFFAGEPPSQIAITTQRVSTIGACPQHPPDLGDSAFDALQGEVRLYTIFGIPYGELRFRCEGSEIIRCPQNTAECHQGRSTAIGEDPRNRKNRG